MVEPTEKAMTPEDTREDVEAEDESEELELEFDGELMGSFDLSDDGDALASCGFGTDEDYGCDGGGDDW